MTHVSFVFNYGEFGPLSFVTVRVDWDIKHKIERAENQDTSPQGRQTSEEERETAPQTVTFVQMGGPYSDGGMV